MVHDEAAQQAPAGAGPQIVDAAQTAFTDAMAPVFWFAAAVVLLTAGLVLRIMPSRGEVVTHEAGFEPTEDLGLDPVTP